MAKLACAFGYFVVGENLGIEKSRATSGPLKASSGRTGWKPGFLLSLASTSVVIFFFNISIKCTMKAELCCREHPEQVPVKL